MAKASDARDYVRVMISTLALAFPVISSREADLRADCARLIDFEVELSQVLEESQELANVRGTPGDWDTGCHHHWDYVTAVLRRIHRLVGELHDAVGNSHSQSAWKVWEELLLQEARLATALSGLSEQSSRLNEAAAMDWKTLALTIQSHRKAMQVGIQGLQLRLKYWASHSPPDADSMTIPAALPEPEAERAGAKSMDPLTYTREFDQAAIEIEAEQHQEMGLLDGVKALFMWVETPGERVRKRHAA